MDFRISYACTLLHTQQPVGILLISPFHIYIFHIQTQKLISIVCSGDQTLRNNSPSPRGIVQASPGELAPADTAPLVMQAGLGVNLLPLMYLHTSP